MSRFSGRRAAQLITLVLLVPSAALATWPHVSWEALQLWSQPRNASHLSIAPDGAGGYYLCYLADADGLTDYEVRFQHLDAEGNKQLDPDGSVVLPTSLGSFFEPQIVRSGPDGVIIVASSDDFALRRVRVQKVLADGSLPWGALGIDPSPGLPGVGQFSTYAVGDGAGGVILGWDDERDYATNERDIYAQRVDPDGNRLWGESGVPVSVAPDLQRLSGLLADGQGGAFFIWEDARDFATSGTDIYFQRMVDGLPVFTENGLRASTGTDNQFRPVMAPDGLGGIYVAWEEFPAGGVSNIVTAGFTGDTGALVHRAVYNPAPYEAFGPALAGLGPRGFVVCWTDGRDESLVGRQIYAQFFAPGGIPQWEPTGIAVGPANGWQNDAFVADDGHGGVVVAWDDERNDFNDVFAQRIRLDDGALLWNPSGLAVYGGIDFQYVYDLHLGADGTALVAFADWSRPGGHGVAVQRIDIFGYLGQPDPVLTAVTDYPQDQGGLVSLDWTASYVDGLAYGDVRRYSIWRRNPAAKSVPGEGTTGRLAALAAGFDTGFLDAQINAGWSYVGDSPAAFQTGYAFEAPTYQDNVDTEFKVIAHAEGATPFWESQVLAGRSQDNLAPGAPASLGAALAGSDIRLTWRPSGVDDEDLLRYRIYRSAMPAFTPTPDLLAGTSADTTFVDAPPAGYAWYYQVTGEDLSGNEGEPSAELDLAGVAAVDGDGVPRLSALLGNHPNPFNPRTRILVAVPRAAVVRLAIYDARGRLVRHLHDDQLPAGRHELVWDGRDDNGGALASGVYVARLEMADGTDRLKMTLMK